MSREYKKAEALSEEVFQLKAAGKTNREIGEKFGLSKTQIEGLVKRQNKKVRLVANGYVPRTKGRPRKNPADEETRRNNELVALRMQVELLRNFLCRAEVEQAVGEYVYFCSFERINLKNGLTPAEIRSEAA